MGYLRKILGGLTLWMTLAIPSQAQEDYIELLDNDWIEVRSDNIVIITDANEKKARDFLIDIEKFRQLVLHFLSFKPRANIQPLTIYAFSRMGDFKTIAFTDGLAGYFTRSFKNDFAALDISGYRTGSRDNWARFVLFHEYIHYILHTHLLTTKMPMWFEEGFADYMSTTLIKGNTASVGMLNEYNLYDISTLFDVETLFNTTELPHSKSATSKIYQHSYAVVHYLYTMPGMMKNISPYLVKVHSGENPQAAFESSFGISYKDFNREMIKYIKRNKYTYWKMDESTGLRLTEPLSPNPRRLGKSEFAIHLARILYRAGRDEEARNHAFTLVNHAIELDATNDRAYSELALQHLDQNHLDESRAALDKAIKLSPDSSWTQTVEGIWLLGKARKQMEDGDGAWQDSVQAARGKFRLALHQDKTNALAFDGLGDVYLMLTDEPDVNEGILAYNQSIYLSPEPGTAYKLAVLYNRSNDTDSAKELLVHVIHDSDNSELVGNALKLLREIDPVAADQTGNPGNVEANAAESE